MLKFKKKWFSVRLLYRHRKYKNADLFFLFSIQINISTGRRNDKNFDINVLKSWQKI